MEMHLEPSVNGIQAWSNRLHAGDSYEQEPAIPRDDVRQLVLRLEELCAKRIDVVRQLEQLQHRPKQVGIGPAGGLDHPHAADLKRVANRQEVLHQRLNQITRRQRQLLTALDTFLATQEEPPG